MKCIIIELLMECIAHSIVKGSGWTSQLLIDAEREEEDSHQESNCEEGIIPVQEEQEDQGGQVGSQGCRSCGI